MFWGFYLTDYGIENPWKSLIKTEKWALNHAKYILKLNKLFCETLFSNETVWKLHQRFGFKKYVFSIKIQH